MKVKESFFRDLLRIFVWYPIRWLTKIISVDLGLLLFKVMGDVHFYAGGWKKRNLFHNIQKSLNTGRNTKDIVKKYFEMYYIDRLHIFFYPKLTCKKEVENYVYIEGLESLERELGNNKGVLVVQPHFGPVQITLLTIALLGYNPIQIGYLTDMGLSKIGRSVAFKYRAKYESKLPAPILSGKRYLRKVYKHLLNGGVVLTTGDGAGGGVYLGEHQECDFLGSKRKMPLGPAIWSIKTGAAYIPTFIIPENYKRFRIVFEEPIRGINGDIDKDKIYITKRFIEITERYIRRYPHCWHFWDEFSEGKGLV